MATSVKSKSYSDCDLFVVPNISFNFVENYVRSSNKASGESYISKGYKYFSEHYIFGIKGKCIYSFPLLL